MLRTILLSAAIIPLIATGALAAPEVTAQQAAAVKATCSKVMRLSPGQAEFEGCVGTLSDELAGEMRYARASDADRACSRSGVRRGTPDFGRCVLDGEDAGQAGAPELKLDAAAVKPADNDPGSYFSAPFTLRRKREQYACAEIALEPSSAPFESCVTDLDTNLWNIEHPPN